MNHRREEVQMITVKTYRGHIRNWKELCAELEIDPALPRKRAGNSGKSIPEMGRRDGRPYLWYVCFCPVG